MIVFASTRMSVVISSLLLIVVSCSSASTGGPENSVDLTASEPDRGSIALGFIGDAVVTVEGVEAGDPHRVSGVSNVTSKLNGLKVAYQRPGTGKLIGESLDASYVTLEADRRDHSLGDLQRGDILVLAHLGEGSRFGDTEFAEWSISLALSSDLKVRGGFENSVGASQLPAFYQYVQSSSSRSLSVEEFVALWVDGSSEGLPRKSGIADEEGLPIDELWTRFNETNMVAVEDPMKDSNPDSASPEIASKLIRASVGLSIDGYNGELSDIIELRTERSVLLRATIDILPHNTIIYLIPGEILSISIDTTGDGGSSTLVTIMADDFLGDGSFSQSFTLEEGVVLTVAKSVPLAGSTGANGDSTLEAAD